MLVAGIEHAERAHAWTPQARSLQAEGWIHIQRGQLAQARARAEAIVSRSRTSGDRLSLAKGLELAARARLFLGEPIAAEDEAGEMVRVLDGLTWRTGYGYNLLARARFERGDVAGARAALETGTSEAADTGNERGLADLLLPAIDLALASGRLEDADRAIDRLQQLDEHSSSPLQAARYRWKRALVQAAHGDLASARPLLAGALAAIEYAPGYAAELRLDLARLDRARGDRAAAISGAKAAAAAFAAMGARDLEACAQSVVAEAAATGDVAVARAALARAEELAAASDSALTRIAVGLARERVPPAVGGGERVAEDAGELAARLGLDGLVANRGRRR